ncbi:response regulator receiver protein [Parvibaculum lavamentivorans DS-1]|uniref:Response regulator receiver protein n=1 Tax=Parvibaculum lavamentivorans (strain DS-1 / DSM 13023 / NCIMB 13966) TaxID=402881 RepID=A7HUS1_PARL1|nr:response regulator [Parvibaculum lavamentivorans]ABS63654.1 response regulator receiver protein [Parvibaculum lavamentivorans DS-1]
MKSFQTATIYVVDDDDAVRDSMRALLESHGLTVRDYSSALHFLSDNDDDLRAKGSIHGCLLLDLHMPGMNGVELLERLKEMENLLPVIVFTGRADAVLRNRVMQAGACALLEKPVNEDDLKREIGRTLRGKALD